ncbi:MAG: glutamate 5-kinase, partial [Caldilineaceae bacterium]|nr:glutamate 5-kinase [Caldilineaceae bacterium]
MYKRIVIKLGTSVLTGGGRHLDRARMVELVRQCAQLHHAGHEVIVTSSGAIAVGRAHLGFPDLPNSIVNKQLFASVGQIRLILMWERFFDIYNVRVGQILLTRADVENRQRYLNARDTFSALIEQRIIPVVNENDAVATEEIKVGDNDNLSALVTTLTNADLLLILTDQPGLFTADPRTNPDAELISEVNRIDDSLIARAGGTNTGLGVGGMATKLQAANIARHAGADVVICAGREPDVILRVVNGEPVGTRFPALETRLESRKRWILAGPKPAGILTVDHGAA